MIRNSFFDLPLQNDFYLELRVAWNIRRQAVKFVYLGLTFAMPLN